MISKHKNKDENPSVGLAALYMMSGLDVVAYITANCYMACDLLYDRVQLTLQADSMACKVICTQPWYVHSHSH